MFYGLQFANLRPGSLRFGEKQKTLEGLQEFNGSAVNANDIKRVSGQEDVPTLEVLEDLTELAKEGKAQAVGAIPPRFKAL